MVNQKLSSISFFFPCFNDRNTIGKLILEANKIGPKIADDWEIIVVNDGSYDDSPIILNKLKRKIKRLKIITHEKNTGYGGALSKGFRNTTKDTVFYTDGDGQYSLNDIYKLIALLDDKTDFVNGIKLNRSDDNHRIW
jgi:glycosyltransferase involved in cell wall biosynthesis